MVLLFSDVVWWLLETVLILGISWSRIRARRAGAAVWLAVVWLLVSAARFTPQVIALTTR
ncbi:hypothetical protein [Pseudofrankia asymbiotica]|nr:hypothetical protein [Pseudofrankia asymbiotica]